MNDDPYGNLLPSSSVLPLPLALLLFVLGALFAMCESAAETANESRIKKDAESGEPRAKKLLEYLERSVGIISPLQSGMMLMGFFALAVAVTGFAPRLYNVFIRAALPTAAPPSLYALVLLRAFGTALHIAVRRSLSNGSRPRSEKIRSAQGCTRHAAYIQTLPHAVRSQRRHASVCPLVQLHFGRSHASFGQRPQSA